MSSITFLLLYQTDNIKPFIELQRKTSKTKYYTNLKQILYNNKNIWFKGEEEFSHNQISNSITSEKEKLTTLKLMAVA